MSEAELEQHVRRLLRDLGLYGYHTRNSRGSAKGFPDWVIISPKGVLWRELKSESGALTREQRRVGYLLEASGLDFGVWRPADLTSGRIARELADIA